jgi:hypothetical protein
VIRPLTSVILALTLLLATSTPPTERKAQSSQSHAHDAHPNPSAPVPQELFCPLWRTDNTFEATIRLKNELVIGPMTVIPVLFMADGTEYDLKPLTIDPADVATISINDALQEAPASLQEHLSQFGSASLRFIYGWNAVSGSIQSLNRPRSLIYQYPFVHPMSVGSGPQVIEGLWWKHDPGVDGFVALSNTTGETVDAHVGLSDSRGLDGPGKELTVPAHGTEWVRLSQLDRAERSDERGGVTISWKGEADALTIAGGLENALKGFSAPMVFRTSNAGKSAAQTVSYASVGIMVGNPDPMMGFPSGTKFSPYAVLRNGDSKPLQVQPSLCYLQGMDTKQLQVKPFTLSARQAKSLDLQAMLEAAGIKNYSGVVHLQLSYQGNPGALMIATGSVDQTGSYVFDVSAKGINQDRGKRISYWENGGGTDTMFTLWNPDPSPQELVVTLYFHNGTYKVPVHLDPNGTSMFNISELVMKQAPDADGHVLPRDASSGSALVYDATDRRHKVRIVVSVGTFNVQTATCGEQCSGCDDYQNFAFSPGSLSIPVSQGTQWHATATMSDGTTWDCTSDVNWQSQNTSIATVSSSQLGYVSAISAGSVAIDGFMDDTVTDSLCYTQGICDNHTLTTSGTVYGQVPTSLEVLNTQVIDMSYGGYSDNVYGIETAITYQVKDQFGAPLLSNLMEPQERVYDYYVNGQKQADPKPNRSDIGPSSYPGTSQFTGSNGQFIDAPVGTGQALAFTATVTQDMYMLLGGTAYPMRTNDWNVTASSSGHGSITNNNDVSETR